MESINVWSINTIPVQGTCLICGFMIAHPPAHNDRLDNIKNIEFSYHGHVCVAHVSCWNAEMAKRRLDGDTNVLFV